MPVGADRTDTPSVHHASATVRDRPNPPRYRYGRFRLWGDLVHSRYFALAGQPDTTVLMRSLSIVTGGDVLGRAFQTLRAVRQLSVQDHTILLAYAHPCRSSRERD